MEVWQQIYVAYLIDFFGVWFEPLPQLDLLRIFINHLFFAKMGRNVDNVLSNYNAKKMLFNYFWILVFQWWIGLKQEALAFSQIFVDIYFPPLLFP